MTGIGTVEMPFGVTLDDVQAFDHESKPDRIHNSPVRDVEHESFWDFMNGDCPEDSFTHEIIEAIKGD